MVFSSGSMKPHVSRAMPPLQNEYIRCQVEATIFQSQEKGGFRAVILDGDGTFVAVVNGPIENVLDPHLVEAIACQEALSWIKEKGFTKVHLESESDCLNVIEAIKNYKLDLSYSYPIIAQCWV